MKRIFILTGVFLIGLSTAFADSDIHCEISKIGSKDGSTAESQVVEIPENRIVFIKILPNSSPNTIVSIGCRTSFPGNVGALTCGFTLPKKGETFKTATSIGGVSTKDLNIFIGDIAFFCESKQVSRRNAR